MPRVYTKTRSNRGTKTYTCGGCGEAVLPGERYYSWQRRYMPEQYRHVACGYPKRTQLSGAKTAVVEDAVQDAQGALAGITYAGPPAADAPEWAGGTYSVADVTDEIRDAMEPVADEAEGVADEYEDSANNMPESLQDGAQAEAIRDVAERLREWAEQVRDWEPSEGTEVDMPELAADADQWAADAQEAVNDQVQALISDAEGVLGEMPYYEG